MSQSGKKEASVCDNKTFGNTVSWSWKTKQMTVDPIILRKVVENTQNFSMCFLLVRKSWVQEGTDQFTGQENQTDSKF